MFFRTLVTESLKLRHGKVTWLTLLVFSLGPLAIALFVIGLVGSAVALRRYLRV
jgi:hypothetical protein